MNKGDISRPNDSMRMSVGLAVHKKYAEVAVVDEEDVVTKQERTENEPGRVEEFSNTLSNAGMVLESSSSWYWLYEILSRKHIVVLSNLAKTKAIGSAKLLKIVYWVLREKRSYHS